MFENIIVGDRVIVVKEGRLMTDNRVCSIGYVVGITKAGNIKVNWNGGKIVSVFKPNGAEYGCSRTSIYGGISRSIIPYDDKVWEIENRKNTIRFIRNKLEKVDWSVVDGDKLLSIWEIIKPK